MKRFDFTTIILGILILLTLSLTSCSIDETVEPTFDCRNFQIIETSYHHIQLQITSDQPSVEVCTTSSLANGTTRTRCKTVVARNYNCYGITGTEGIAHCSISVDGCERIAW